MPETHSHRSRATALVLGLLLGLAAFPARGLSTDREEPINIEADRAEADEKRRVTIYRGEAIITQGTLRITGDTIWIYLNENDEFVKLVSVGHPARMRQLPDGAKDFRTADANRLEYFAQQDLIVLLGDAVYGQGKDQIAADRIEYDSHRGRMKARSKPKRAAKSGGPSKSGGSRVKITIVPKKGKKSSKKP